MKPAKRARWQNASSESVPSVPSLQDEMDRAIRQRNFGDATRCFHKMKSQNYSPSCVLKYIKACLRCGQIKVAEVWRQTMSTRWNPLSADVQCRLQQLFCRGYGDVLDMVKLYSEARTGLALQQEESVCQDILRGMVKAGWVMEGVCLIKYLYKSDSWNILTIELIIELIHGIIDPSCQSSEAMQLGEIQKSWYALALPPVTIPELIAQLHIEIMIYSTAADHERERVIEQLLGNLIRQLQQSDEFDKTTLPANEQLAESILVFWDHKVKQFQKKFEFLKEHYAAKQVPGNTLYMHTALDHLIADMPHIVWSNRYHPAVVSSLYDFEWLKPNAQDIIELPMSATDFCSAFLKSTDWAEAERVCKKLVKRIRKQVKRFSNKSVLCELGAGNGDWAVNQNEDLIAINELRWNRCKNIRETVQWREDAKRFIVLGGDGTRVLEDYMNKACTKVQINFPEPPAIRGDISNWLSSHLFDVIHTSLRSDESKFLLISDQRSLMEYMDAFIAKKQLQAGKWICETNKTPWHFLAVEDESTVSDLATSFFGQMWANGKKSYFAMCLVKRGGM